MYYPYISWSRRSILLLLFYKKNVWKMYPRQEFLTYRYFVSVLLFDFGSITISESRLVICTFLMQKIWFLLVIQVFWLRCFESDEWTERGGGIPLPWVSLKGKFWKLQCFIVQLLWLFPLQSVDCNSKQMGKVAAYRSNNAKSRKARPLYLN